MIERTCSYCGQKYQAFALPPHACAGLLAAEPFRRVPSEKVSRPERTPIIPGDTVAWTERAGQGRHERKSGVVSQVVENGKAVLIRVGNTLVEKNMGQVVRIARKAAK